ncbi:Uncharacterized conserved protein, DUF1501 family [Cognatiyoonia koreensis]|uniref:Uncharacterized conserved protein, DUF1501 family n=1 Tax=Cognatiyoonia koreensis TaxID=364200 RepID=A0A1I0N3R8_9RHOB|nr:DUF1501 domain-containing protein [Cognatiyoonia koreensis]SEV95283.1 Uncharacterized conserved protein, DUF1501 family [Cognatiyoonia koreensis]
MDRRKFLGTIGCSLAASPLLTPVSFADAPWDNRLVVIILRGAMDGIDAFRPLGDPDYAAMRPDLNDGKATDLDGFWALHPALSPLLPLWQMGEMGFVPAVSTPYRDKRSHFDGQDMLEAGGVALDGTINDGWLNRLLQTMPGTQAEVAYAIGREQMQVLAGPAAAARWSPEAKLQITPQAQRLLELVLHEDPLFQEAAEQAIDIATQLSLDTETEDAMMESMADDPMMQTVASNGAHIKLAQFAAARLRGSTRIASFSINGWDTHQNQASGISRALGRLSDTILTLRAGLGDTWGKTGVLCLTEFGRTARQNGTKGTDHGTAGAMLYAGGAMRGGQAIGHWPGLSEADLYDRRDIMPTADVRAMAAWTMRGLFGVDRAVLERSVFPGLDLGDDPGLLL